MQFKKIYNEYINELISVPLQGKPQNVVIDDDEDLSPRSLLWE